MSHSYKKRRRAELYKEQGGDCYWCHQPMVLLEQYPADGILSDEICTLDHLFDRLHPERLANVPPKTQRWVAACYGCNQTRGVQTCCRRAA